MSPCKLVYLVLVEHTLLCKPRVRLVINIDHLCLKQTNRLLLHARNISCCMLQGLRLERDWGELKLWWNHFHTLRGGFVADDCQPNSAFSSLSDHTCVATFLGVNNQDNEMVKVLKALMLVQVLLLRVQCVGCVVAASRLLNIACAGESHVHVLHCECMMCAFRASCQRLIISSPCFLLPLVQRVH